MPLDPIRRVAASLGAARLTGAAGALVVRCHRFAVSLTRWEKAALAGWGIVLTVVCVRTAIWPKTHTVYPIFALASQNWLAGESLYGETAFDKYRYSPLAAAAFIPLGFLPLWLGGAVWRLLETSLYTAALFWWCRSMAASGSSPSPCPNPNPSSKTLGFGQTQKRQDRNWLAIFFLLALPLSLDNLNNGQSNLLMIGLVVLGILACGAELWSPAGFCIAAASLLKIYPVVIAMLLSVTYPRRFAPRFLVALAAGILLPFFLQRPGYVLEQYQSWARYLGTEERQGLDPALWYRDLRLLARLCGIDLTGLAYHLIQAIVGAGVAGICLAARRRGWPRRDLALLVLGLGSCWMTVFGVAAETSTYVIVAPVAAWCVVEAWRRQRPVLERLTYLAIYLSFGLARAAGSNEFTRPFSMVAQPCTALLLFFVLLATALWHLRVRPLNLADGVHGASAPPQAA